MPKISVIIPVYNAQNTINECLNSIFNQTFKDLEVIAINDGSTDSSWSILEKWQDKVKIFKQANSGAPAARNLGFGKSQGEYVIFCDADVVMRSDMLKKMLEVLERNKDTAYVYSSFKFGWKTFKIWPYDLNKLKLGPYIPTTSLIRRSYFPRFDESLKKFQDWDLWLTISERGGKGIWLNEVLFYAKTGGTMSRWLPKFFYKLSWLKFV
ncbi:MAG: glycosyltransferase family 2 protein, partial [Patescibacteria group bacterium]